LCNADIEGRNLRKYEPMLQFQPVKKDSNRQFSKAQFLGNKLAGKCPESLRKLAPNPSEGKSSFTCYELKSHWLKRQTGMPKGATYFHGRMYIELKAI
jgi:hypothetical protein